MSRRPFRTFLAVITFFSNSIDSNGECNYAGNSLNCSMIKSVNQLFNVSDVSLLNATYPEVTQLTIQNSRLSFSEDLTRFFPNVHTVNLSWTSVSCTKDLLWLLTWQDRLVDPEKVLCFTEAGASGSSSLQAIKTLHSFKYVEDNCQSGCNCTYDKNKDYVVISCSNLGLTTLPRVLPWNVTRIELDLSNNKIRNISELATNETYVRVHKLNLTNNLVTSISNLKGFKWIKDSNGLELSLQGNRMHEIPLDVLNSAHGHWNYTEFRFYLSNNPWRCDCYSVTKFQRVAVQMETLIKDTLNVTCGPDEGENAGKRIMYIELDVVCPADTIMEMAMNGLNVVLAFLTALTVGKLLYDFYAYRKTGQLPWLATKLP